LNILEHVNWKLLPSPDLDSDIELAIAFMKKALPEFVRLRTIDLLKVGRSVKSLVEMVDDLPLGRVSSFW
jgi:hypothetical protein